MWGVVAVKMQAESTYLHKSSGRNFEFGVAFSNMGWNRIKERKGKWEVGGDWEEEWAEEESQPARLPCDGTGRVSEDRDSFQALGCAVQWLAPLWGLHTCLVWERLPCFNGVWGDQNERLVFHIWVYAAWMEKNGLKEPRLELTENSTEVKVRIKGTITNMGSPRNYQISEGGGEKKPYYFPSFV